MGGYLCHALTLGLLDHVEMLFGTAGVAESSIIGWGKVSEEMAVYLATWFLSPIEILQYIYNRYNILVPAGSGLCPQRNQP